MSHIILKLIIVVAIAIDTNATIQPSDTYAAMLLDETTEIVNVPYLVSFLVTWIFDESENRFTTNKRICEGTIIGKRWILVSAHCSNKKNAIYSVRIGNFVYHPDAKSFTVIQIITHPKYNPETRENNISLLKLDRFILLSDGQAQAHELPEQNEPIYVKETFQISTWGVTRDNRYEIKTFLADIVDYANCSQKYQTYESYIITNNMICATRINKDSCKYESGGSLLFNDKKLIGIASFGVRCSSQDFNYPGVYTRVSAYRNWIREITRN